MSNILHYIANTILIALPEQVFISMMAIVILRSLSIFETNRNKKLILIVLPAVISSIPEMVGLDSNFSLVAGLVITIAIFAILTRRKIILVILSVLASMTAYALTELAMVSLIMHSLNLSLQEIQSNSLNLFFTSIPERVIQYSILYMASFKKLKYLFKNRPTNVNLVSIVRLDPHLIKNSIISLVMGFIYIVFFSKLIAIDGVFLKLSPLYGLMACSLIFFMPFVFFMTFSEIVVRDYINRLAMERHEKEYQREHKNLINHKLVQVYDDANKLNDEKTMQMVTEILSTVNCK